MNSMRLTKKAEALVGADEGLLAIDESNSTCNNRIAPPGIPQTERFRRAYIGN